MFNVLQCNCSENPLCYLADQPQSGLLWRLSSGAVGGVYNVASGAAGMGYSGTKWVLGKHQLVILPSTYCHSAIHIPYSTYILVNLVCSKIYDKL